MDEKLKNQLLISVIPAGIVFMGYMLTIGFWGQKLFLNNVIAFVLGAVVGGAVLGILYMVQKD
jgi:hypothetical protein